MRVIVQEKLVVDFWDLIPMESVADNSVEQDTSAVTKDNQEPSAKQKSTLWLKEQNWPILNKSLERLMNPTLDGVCDEDNLELGKDTVS